MKTIIVALVGALVGLAIGTSSAYYESWRWPWVGVTAASQSASHQGAVVGASQPRVAVDEEKHDFGVMDSISDGRHDFVFRNIGTAPLKLVKGDTSCACTLSHVAAGEIPPGESATVTLEWSAEGRVGSFRQVATIFTNDPLRPRITLTVEGRVKGAVIADPPEVVFGSVAFGQDAETSVRLWSYLKKPMQISGCTTTDEEHIAVSYRPLPPEELLEAEEATSGWKIDVSLKSGLPVGPFRKRIELRTDSAQLPVYIIPVMGVVTSEMSVAGPGWDERNGLLKLGDVRGSEGVQRRLYLRVEAADEKELELEATNVVPDLLQVQLGQASKAAGGRVVLVPMTIEVPKGSRPANYLGPGRDRLGRVTIRNKRPGGGKIDIYVEFSVRE